MKGNSDHRDPNVLASLAFVEASIDSGTDTNKTDRLGLFMPFVEDAVVRLVGVKFQIADIVSLIDQRCGIVLPSPVIEMLLRRLIKSGFIARSNGAYGRTAKPMPNVDLSIELKTLDGELSKLIRNMSYYARKIEERKLSNGQCRRDLITYFDDHLDSLSTREVIENEKERKSVKWVGRYLLWAKSHCKEHFEAAVKLVRGHIVYEAALLPGFSSNSQSLEGTVLYLDSPTVCRALGFASDEDELLVNEAITILKNAGAELRVFDITAEEMKRVLLGVIDRWDSLKRFDRPDSYDIHLRRRGYSLADIHRIASDPAYYVQNKLGFQIDETPSREFLYVYDEATLFDLLKRPDGFDAEAAITHDVNCIAAVLTLREKLSAKTFKSARYFFVTTSMMTVRQANKWWKKTENPTILAPIFSLTKMANLAWLYSNPSSDKQYGEKALLSACAAAAMPTDRLWESFAHKLLKYNKDGQITQEAAAHYLYSMDTRKVLAAHEESYEIEEEFEADSVLDEADSIYRKKIIDDELKLARKEVDDVRREVLTAQAEINTSNDELRHLSDEIQGYRESNTKLLTQNENLKEKLEKKSKHDHDKAAKLVTFILRVLALLFFILIIALLCCQFALDKNTFPATVISAIIDIIALFSSVYSPLKNRLIGWVEKKLFSD